jgi:ribonuclease G
MYISSSPHETKVAVLEDDQLVEVYFERDTDVGLVGGIYKGRVSRVLPGMQSAFVDIGLERDAFLYVSDFFYEDQEEYDKVFEEAEARATKFTAQQAEAPATPTAPAAPAVTEPPPPVVAEVAPPPPAPPVAPPPVESPAATVAPPTSVAAPPASRDSHDRRPFDPRRGRRRRHRGRPDFGESRHGDRRFPPPHRPEEPPTESHPFEILPGESLAKYSHAASVPPEEMEAGMPEGTLPEVGQEALLAADEDAFDDKISIEGDEAIEGETAVAEIGEMSAEASAAPGPVAKAPEVEWAVATASAAELAAVEPAVATAPVAEAAEVGPAVAAEVSPEAQPAADRVVLTDATVPFAPRAIYSINYSAVAQSAPAEVAEAPVPASVVPVQAPREEPAPVEPTASAPASPAVEVKPVAEIPASSFPAEAAASYPPEGVAGPSSGEAEPKEAAKVEAPPEAAAKGTVESAEAIASSEFAEAAPESAEASPESAEAEAASDVAELNVLEEDVEGEEENLEEGEELAEASEGELDDEGELPAEVATGAEGEEQPVAQEAAPDDDPGSRAPGAPGDRTYTLREPHQRPRFAPRRRRDRRGPGDGQRRFDKPRESSRPGNHHPVQIAEVLKEGQEILVQIAKEPLGSKGARITSHVALPGRYLVYMPTIDHIGVSRKITSEEERLRLRNTILENKGALTGGFIVRTAGQGRSEDEFKADLKFLSTLWNEIRSKADRLRAPALIHRDLDLVQRLLRDLLTPDFKCVRVDSEIDYERVLDFVSRCQPGLVGKVKLYSRDTPLYEEFGIQQEIERALKPKVWLKSGGYIVINQTEALVAIDVNTGKYVGKTNRLEDTIVKTNIDAVHEIVRQVRLRDLGGIIVIDFIDMDERKNRAKVVQALEEALRSDRAPTKVISFHDFGLVAVTRKRVKQSLERTLCQRCDYCTGSGWVKSVNTVCNEILAEARKMAKEIDGNVMTLRVNPEVAKALKSREGALVSELESLTKKEVIIKSDPNVHQERFEIY